MAGRFLILLIAWLGISDGACHAVEATRTDKKGTVIVVQDQQATRAFTPQPLILGNMISEGMRMLTGKPSAKEAWLSVINTNDVVGLKVYTTSGGGAGTRPAVVAQVIESLLEAGISQGKIVIWDRREADLRAAGYLDLAAKYKVRVLGSQEAGYDADAHYSTPLLGNLVFGDLDFGKKGPGIGRNSYVTKLLTHEITKVINITPLLNHNSAGISGVLFGLSMGSVDNFMRFEADPERLASAIPEIYAMPEIGDKVALNIVDALIGQYQGEERTYMHYAAELDQLWFSFDPVAVDVLGIAELQRERKKAGIAEQKINMEIYRNSALLELGEADESRIQVIKRVLGQ
jgi:hypothetical protein